MNVKNNDRRTSESCHQREQDVPDSRHEQEPILLARSQGNVPCPVEIAQRSPLLQRLEWPRTTSRLGRWASA